MINGLEGIPGSGKSYEATVYHVLDALKKGRMVVTNLPLNVEAFGAIDPSYPALIEIRTKPLPIRGTWDANRTPAFLVEGEARQPAESVPVFGHVWDYYHEWKHPETGQGPLFVIDECHVAMPKKGYGTTDAQVIQWYKLHRHFNQDVLLMTQSFRDMEAVIAGLMGVMIRVRKADILGKPDHYIRKVHGGFRGAVISSEKRKYIPEYFKLYRSHTQGNSVSEAAASDVAPFLVKFNRLKWAWLAVSVVVTVWAFWPSGDKPKPVAARPAPKVAAYDVKEVAPGTPGGVPVALQVKHLEAVPEAAPVAKEPLAGKGVHITGAMFKAGGATVYTFTVSDGSRRVFDTTARELAVAGYRWTPQGECVGVLQWEQVQRVVLCDAPAVAEGTGASKPWVIADGSKASSLDK